MKRIAVTGASGNIAYSAIFRIASGELFADEPIALHLLDIPEAEGALKGIKMELDDCVFPALQEIQIGSNPYRLFEEIDLALFIGAKPRTKGMERSDLLQENGKIFIEQGKALEASAKREAKVFVVGNPCNTNCLIALHHAPSLNPKNFHAMMRLDQNRAISLLAKKTNVSLQEVTEMIVWGNHSTTQVPDFTNAKIRGQKALEVLKDREWLQDEFLGAVRNRGAEIIEARGKSSAASAANGLLMAVKSLYKKEENNPIFSSAVYTAHNPYGLDEDLIFGLPCRTIREGEYEIVKDFEWDFFIKEQIAVTQKELIAERDSIRDLL